MKKTIVLLSVLFGLAAFAGVQGYNGTSSLGVFAKVKCSTGLTCSKDGDALKLISSPSLAGPLTLQNGEVITNATDDTVSIQSDDNDTTLQVLGFEAKNAILQLYPDQGDDNADKYSIEASAADVLAIKNNGTSLLSFSTTGVMTLSDSETLTDSADVVTLGFDDAAADFRLNAFEATDASITLQADESDDNGDDWKLSSLAAGGFQIANDVSGAQVAKWSMTTAGNVSMVGSLTGDGGDSLSGFLQKQVSATATTITAAQCGSTFYNAGAVVINLPEASGVLGCRLTFVTMNASNFDVNPDDGDQILVETNAAGDAMRNNTLGNSITIEAMSASQWAPVGIIGTWSDIN